MITDYHIFGSQPHETLHEIRLQRTPMNSEVFKIIILWEPRVKGQRTTLTFHTHKSECTRKTLYTRLGQNLQNKPSRLLRSNICPYFILPSKRSRSTQGLHLKIHGSTEVSDPSHQVSRLSVNWFCRRTFLKFFLPYMGMPTILTMWPGRCAVRIHFRFLPHGGCIWNLVIIGLMAFEEIFRIVKLWILGQMMTLTFCTYLS